MICLVSSFASLSVGTGISPVLAYKDELYTIPYMSTDGHVDRITLSCHLYKCNRISWQCGNDAYKLRDLDIS